MDTTDILLLVLAGGQAIAIPVGLWIGKSIVDLKVSIASYQVTQNTHEQRIHNLEEYRQSTESKVKEMWGHYIRNHRDSKGDHTSHRG